MLNFSVTSIGEYTKTEKYRQTVNAVWLSFYVSGAKHIKLYAPDGKIIRNDVHEVKPHFSFSVPGMVVDFEMSESRLNWVIMLDDMPISLADDGSSVELINNGERIQLPLYTAVQHERLDGWLMEFKRMKKAFSNPTPKNILRVNLGISNIIRYIIDQAPDSIGERPEEKLKHFIDTDKSFSKSISAFSRKCGVSKDHLRLLFQKRFSINPVDYRKLKRMAHVMELVGNSNLSVKEIAINAGFKHVSHLCMEFQKKYGMTPKEGIRRFRYMHT